jgi:hypothetical protein
MFDTATTGLYRNFIYYINIVLPSLYTPSDTPYLSQMHIYCYYA